MESIKTNYADEKNEPKNECIHSWLGRDYEGGTDKCGDNCPKKNKDNCDHIDSDTVDSVVYSVLQNFTQRAKFGKEKYNTDLDRTDLNLLDWVTHTQEELMDATLYLEKLKKDFVKMELDKKGDSYCSCCKEKKLFHRSSN